MPSDRSVSEGHCQNCHDPVTVEDNYCSGCGSPLTEVARYESLDEVYKVNSALRSLFVFLLIFAARLSVPAAILGFIAGSWPPEAIGVSIVAATLSFGLERVEYWLTRRETPDEVLEEWGWEVSENGE